MSCLRVGFGSSFLIFGLSFLIFIFNTFPGDAMMPIKKVLELAYWSWRTGNSAGLGPRIELDLILHQRITDMRHGLDKRILA